MLKISPVERMSAIDAFNHPWFFKLKKKDEHKAEQLPLPGIILDRLKKFIREERLKKSIFNYVSVFVNGREKKKKLTKQFKEIDKNNDGLIQEEEVVEAITKLYTDRVIAEFELDVVLSEFPDSVQYGDINYVKFIDGLCNCDE
jgi:hypothetical protein